MTDARYEAIQVNSTADVPLETLRELAATLAPGLVVRVEDRQFFFKSMQAPSWVSFVADADFWIKAFGAYAAIYAAELVKQAATATWRVLANRVAGAERGDPLVRFADEIQKLQAAVSADTRIELALPIPDDDHWTTRLEIRTREAADIAAEVSLFVRHLPAIRKVIADFDLAKKARSGIKLELLDDGDMAVTWMDSAATQEKTVVISLRSGRIEPTV